MLLWSIAAASALTGSIDIDLTRYFPNDAVEESDRAILAARIDSLLQQPVAELAAPGRLAVWLNTQAKLVTEATELIERRTAALEKLYGSLQ